MKKQKVTYLTRHRTWYQTDKREFHVTFWRLCNAKGNDMVTPWKKSSQAARDEARERNWKVIDRPYSADVRGR